MGFARTVKQDVTHARGVPYRYTWKDTYKALHTMKDADRDPCDGVLLRYINPVTGGFTYPTMSCEIELLHGKDQTRRHRHTSTSLYHVFKGSGRTAVGEGFLEWKQGDSFVIPLWQWHQRTKIILTTKRSCFRSMTGRSWNRSSSTAKKHNPPGSPK